MATAYSFSTAQDSNRPVKKRRPSKSTNGLSTAPALVVAPVSVGVATVSAPSISPSPLPAAQVRATKAPTTPIAAGRVAKNSPAYVWPLGVAAVPTDRVEICPAGAGDHPAIHQLLTTVFHAPTRDEFSASLEDPFYEPHDRLVVRRGTQVIAHLHLAHRVMQFGADSFPISSLHRMAVLPEYRGRDYGGRLLEQADAAMRAEGSVLGVLTTRIPHYFRRADWVVCMRQSRAQVGARHLLAQLSARGVASQVVGDAVNIRPWRHVELPSLVRLYSQYAAGSYGAYERTDAYWRWLVNRYGSDGIFVARIGPRRFDLDFDDGTIVGYVIQKDDRILELVAAPKNPGVKERLLARALGEAVERDHHDVRLDLSPDDSVWHSVERSGGSIYRGDSCQGEVTMVKLFEPLKFIERLLPVLHDRAEAAGLKRPTELALVVGKDLRRQLSVSRREVRVAAGARSKARLRLSPADLTRLLLGHLDLPQVLAEGRVKASSETAGKVAAALFPQRPLRHPPLDDLLVQ